MKNTRRVPGRPPGLGLARPAAPALGTGGALTSRPCLLSPETLFYRSLFLLMNTTIQGNYILFLPEKFRYLKVKVKTGKSWYRVGAKGGLQSFAWKITQ